MRRLLFSILTIGLLIAAAAFSNRPSPPGDDLRVKVEDRNPWTHLRLNNNPEDFHFAIVSDRTGRHRANIFARAVEQLNLLQPEFVVSVGDLIEGGSEDRPEVAEEWRELEGYLNRLQMPFFFVPGNHDISNPVMEKMWKEKFGRRYYHFTYRNVLFLFLNSEDSARTNGRIDVGQLLYLQRVLGENRDVRWTVVVLHKPLWTFANADNNGWPQVEKVLGDRPYTVFCGHRHRYQKYVRNGRSYYQLATTGGSSRLRGVAEGEFDHLVWVTMKKDGPMLANILLDGIYSESLSQPETNEPGSPVPAK